MWKTIAGALLPLGLCLAAGVHADFPGGSVEKVEKVSDRHFRIFVKGEVDQAGRNRQASWYYFRVTGAARSPMTFDMVGLPGEYNYQPNKGAITGATPPSISYDRKTWTHVTDVEYDAKQPMLRLNIVPKASSFWIAHTPPYTLENLASLRKAVLGSRYAQEESIGKTLGGRDVYLWTISEGAPTRTVWLMFRQHSWESGTSWVGEGAVRALLAQDPRGAELRRAFTWKIYPLCDPDGVERGGVRFNAKGYDLNRNWDVEDATAMPEITAQRNTIAAWIRSGRSIDLFLSLHNTETSEYLNGPPETGRIKPVAERFFEALTMQTMFHPSRPLFYSGATTTPGMKGRMSVVQGLHRDFAIPAFLMEQCIAYHQKLSRLPTVPDRLEFGRQLVSAISDALR